jgi:hypothetical protein
VKTLQLLSGEFAVCRLAPDEPVPAWAGSAVFSSITRTRDELSVICPAAQVPGQVTSEGGWRMLKLRGPLPFSATGILHSVLTPLADARISIFALSTYDTDYVLVKATALARACAVLREHGHTVQESTPPGSSLSPR